MTIMILNILQIFIILITSLQFNIIKLKSLITLIVKHVILQMILHAFHAIILGKKKRKKKRNIILIFSGSCETPDYNDCVTCNTTGTNRVDYHSVNMTCPCKPHYYDVGTIICSPCDSNWFEIN